ncbi:MAG TPA: hypothetical protein VKT18_10660, partial [Acidimicrobiales bacterium]|nr:hypothetical protein [Acidimicrobiales bacterium]
MRIFALLALGGLVAVTTASGVPAPPTFLISASQGAGPQDVFVTDADGGGWSSLTGGHGSAWDPSWSPDGTHVVLASNVDAGASGGSDLYVAAADGSTLVRLTSDAAGTGAHSDPQWSADGSTIAYLAGNSSDVWVVPAVGGAPRRLQTTTDQKRGLTWSPVGTTIAFGDWGPSGGPFVIVVDAATGATVARFPGSDPVWSPDGRRIAFVDAAGRLAVAAADGTSALELSRLDAVEPAWSPDGKRIVFAGTVIFTSLPPTRYGYPSRRDVYAVPADGSGSPTRLTGPF